MATLPSKIFSVRERLALLFCRASHFWPSPKISILSTAPTNSFHLALIGLAVWQYSRIWRQQSFNSVRGLFLLGFISSLVPFAKLQGTPAVLVPVVAAFIGLVSLYNARPRTAFWRAMGSFLAGGLTFPLLVVLLTLGFGVFGDFIQFYLIGNVTYGA